MPWEMIKEKLAILLSETTMSLWIAPLECREASEHQLVLEAPDRFFCTWVKENYLSQLRDCLTELGMQAMKIQLTVADANPVSMLPPGKTEGQLRLPNVPKVKSTVRSLHPRYTFDEFMIGESNIMARTVCDSIANNDSAYGRTLFIESGPGLGKSHLTHAVAHKVLSESPSTCLHYLTAQQLTAEMVKHIRSNQMEQFKEKYHHCDVLLIEDIHTLSGRTKTQQELTAALDILLEQDKRVIFTGKTSPRQIPDLEPELRSRLTGSLLATINAPDFLTRTHIVRKKSAYHSLALNEEQVGYIAENVKGDIRQVESALVGLKAKMGLLGCNADLALIKEVISGIMGCSAYTISTEAIRDFIAKQFKISSEELQSKCRKRNVAFPRQVAMYLARKLTEQGLTDIGRAFNRDHSTVVHSVRVITDSINRSGSVKGQIDLLASKINKQFN